MGIRQPDVMLLDEATSALDPVCEREVQDTLDKVMKGFTTISIAHRLTTIKDADKIIVLDHGKLVEEGTHKDLLQIPIKFEDKDGKKIIQSGFYHNQWDTQFNEDKLTVAQTQDKITQLQMEIDHHRSKMQRIKKNVSKVRSAGILSALQARHTRFEDTLENLERSASNESAHQIPLDRFVTGQGDYDDDLDQ